MRYRGSLTVPAGTTKAEPATQDVVMVPGILRELEVFFPAGQGGLVYLMIYQGDHQLYPTNPGECWRGDDTHITLNEAYQLTQKPYTLTLVGWSPATTLDHTVFVDFSLDTETRAGEPERDIALPEE